MARIRSIRGDLSLATARIGKKVRCVSVQDVPGVRSLIIFEIYTIRTCNSQGIRLHEVNNPKDLFSNKEDPIYPYQCFVLA